VHSRALRAVAAAALPALVVAALLAPGAALGAPRPGQSCPDTTPPPSSTEAPCEDASAPGGDPGDGFDLGSLLPFVAAGLVGAGLALVAAFALVRRRSAVPAAPADPGEWWTCRKCGRNNVIGSPRCYACGEWQA